MDAIIFIGMFLVMAVFVWAVFVGAWWVSTREWGQIFSGLVNQGGRHAIS